VPTKIIAILMEIASRQLIPSTGKGGFQ